MIRSKNLSEKHSVWGWKCDSGRAFSCDGWSRSQLPVRFSEPGLTFLKQMLPCILIMQILGMA